MFGKPALQGSHISESIFWKEEIIEAKIQDGKIKFRSMQDKKKSLPGHKQNNFSKNIDKKRIEEKGKSVVGRALVGTLIAGPLGTIVGGMSGLGTKKKKRMSGILLSTMMKIRALQSWRADGQPILTSLTEN